tara:strand:+ start:307 stop:468 length:162 start_codon:yes stop_codon:yes gene_type:complete
VVEVELVVIDIPQLIYLQVEHLQWLLVVEEEMQVMLLYLLGKEVHQVLMLVEL